MTDWVIYALASLAQLSLLMALYKVPAAKQISKYTLSVWTFFFATVLAWILLHSSVSLDSETLLLAFLWGTGYAVLTLIQMHALHLHDTSSVFPFTSLTSNILVIIGGVLFLHEFISPTQWLAVVLAIALFTASYWNKRLHFVVTVLPLFLSISLLSTVNKFLQKAGASHVNPHNFMFWQLVFSFLASIVILLYVKKQVPAKELLHRELLFWAIITGVLQMGSTYTIVIALSVGPISLVYIILGLYTFFTSLFAALFFKEKITARSLLFILLSFFIVLLIKFG